MRERSGALYCLVFFGLGMGLSQAQNIHIPIAPIGEAPAVASTPGPWSEGIKQFFGTSYEEYDADNKYTSSSPTAPLSKVWFTGARGVLTEVYWPTIDRPQIRDSQLLVSDGSSFLFEERQHSNTTVEWVESGAPIYRIKNRDPRNRFTIEKVIYTDPSRDAVIMDITLIRNVGGLKFYWLHNPSAGNSPLGDNAEVATGGPQEAFLNSHQAREFQSVLFSLPIKQASAGFEGHSDGYHDLLSDFVMDSHFRLARNGNIALTAWLDIPEEIGQTRFQMALAFGNSSEESLRSGRTALQNFSASKDLYLGQWKAYQGKLKDLKSASTDGGKLFRSSTAMIKSMEDKTFEGAFIASPSIPWGQHAQDRSLGEQIPFEGGPTGKGENSPVGGYHLVWARDLYQMASTFMALDDPRSAKASLQFFKRIQFGPNDGDWMYTGRRHPKNGSFTQNSWVTGTPYWQGLQMDQTSMPIILAYRLWKSGDINIADYWDMVKRAADFIQAYGPWTAQERWEEAMGASPSTIAAEISALWLAADISREMNDSARAERFAATAKAWSSAPGDNLEAWTFTSTGGLGNGKYYQRIEAGDHPTQEWRPNDFAFMSLSNNAGRHMEKNIIDGGFLELVRFGVRQALDYFVNETLHEYDLILRTQTAKGPGFKRYLHDRYNYVNDTNEQTGGMLWPLLTGERGMMELQRSVELQRQNPSISSEFVDGRVIPYVQAMENFATSSLMIPEQVWDGGAFEGQPTGSATPLGWAHGEYIKLLRGRLDQRSPDLIGRVQELGN